MPHVSTQLGDPRALGTSAAPASADAAAVEQLSLSVHASLDLQRVAFAIANEGRTFAACDRLTVLVRDAAACRLLAMSGVDVPDPRSNVVRRIEQTADLVVRQKLPVWRRDSGGDAWPGATADRDESTAPAEATSDRRQVADALAGLQSETGAQVVCVVPVGDPRASDVRGRGDFAGEASVEPIGVLICEWFPASPVAEGATSAVEALRRVAGLALRNAVEHDRLPLRSLLVRLRSMAGLVRRGRTWIATGVVAAVVAALALIPIELTVTARGKLHPVERRDVFAPADGVVADLRVQHGQSVAIDQLLLTLRNPDLDFEEARIAGELQTAQKRLATVQAARVELPQQSAPSRERANQLSGEEEELRELLASLEQQRQIVIRRQSDLQVRSPLAGQVITWDVQHSLATRPVERGQVLVTVANPEGPWELRLHVAENDVGHVLAARRSGRGDLAITFVLAAQPAIVFSGRVADVSLAADAHEQFGAGVPVTATFDPSASVPRHPGGAVVANIQCGRRSAGFVLFHRVFESLRRWGWF